MAPPVKNRLLAALEASTERAFVCPQTGIEMVIKMPRRRERKIARNNAALEWGDRALLSPVDKAQYIDLNREHLIALCFYVDGEPIGTEAAEALTEETWNAYDDVLRRFEAESDPNVEDWSEEDIEELIEGVKKKDAEIEAVLRISAVPRLLSLLRSMAARLPSSGMSSSITSSDGEPSEPQS